MPDHDFDILVVGGGHAGTEAVQIASRMNMKTGLVTMDKDKLALMSCNPAIGGIGKSHLVREVDILGAEHANLIIFDLCIQCLVESSFDRVLTCLLQERDIALRDQTGDSGKVQAIFVT